MCDVENQFLSLSLVGARCLDVSPRALVFLSVIIDPGFIYREAVSRRDEFPRALDSRSLVAIFSIPRGDEKSGSLTPSCTN